MFRANSTRVHSPSPSISSLFSTGDHIGIIQARMAAEDPQMQAMMKRMSEDPSYAAEVHADIAGDNAEARARGHTGLEAIVREKTEWARRDIGSALLKERGNAALKENRPLDAYILYSACIIQSSHESVYPLNRSVVCLQLQDFAHAVEDADKALAILSENFKEDNARATPLREKALFRKAKGHILLEEYEAAEIVLLKALNIKPAPKKSYKRMIQFELDRIVSTRTEEGDSGFVNAVDVLDPICSSRSPRICSISIVPHLISLEDLSNGVRAALASVGTTPANLHRQTLSPDKVALLGEDWRV